MRRRLLTRAGLTAALALGALSAGLAPAAAAPGGSGPYPADYSTSGSLPNHTIYLPVNLPNERLPIVVWGNGGCSGNGTSQVNFLREIASHGFLVIANGNPNGGGSTTSQMLTQSIDWAFSENSRGGSALNGRIDTSEVAVAGFSCGGLEAYAVAGDPRVTTTAIFSSGLLNDSDDWQLRRLDDPIAYFIGGPSDIAYGNAIDDWGKLPAGLPAFMGNLNVGHGGTYDQYNGGEFARVGTLWFKWQLKGDVQAGRAFVGQNCGLCGTQWDVRQKNLVLEEPTPDPTTPTPDPTTPTPDPTTPTPDPTTPTPDPTDPPVDGACTATYTVASQWGEGFVANVDVTAGASLSGWVVTVRLPNGSAVVGSWSSAQSGTSGTVTFGNAPWNGTLRQGERTSFGFQGTGSGSGATVSCAAA